MTARAASRHASGARARLLLLWALALVASPAAAATFEWVLVGDPGNERDVAENCLAGAHEAPHGQYVEFLNANALVNPHGLFNPLMTSEAQGGITRSSSPRSYTCAPKAGFATSR